MRARKAERCLQRAAEALDTGSIGEASDAFDEARQLSPQHPRLPELSARLEALKHPAPTAQRHSYVWTTAAIVAGVVAFSAAGWQAWVHRDQLAELVPKALPNTDTSTAWRVQQSVPANAPQRHSNAERSCGERSCLLQRQTTRLYKRHLCVRNHVIDTRTEPPSPRPRRSTTTGSGTGSDTKMDAAKSSHDGECV